MSGITCRIANVIRPYCFDEEIWRKEKAKEIPLGFILPVFLLYYQLHLFGHP